MPGRTSSKPGRRRATRPRSGKWSTPRTPSRRLKPRLRHRRPNRRSRSKISRRPRPPVAQASSEPACARNALRGGPVRRGPTRRRRALWQQACERKHPEACRRLALRILADDDRADERRAVRLLDKSCELGSLVACRAGRPVPSRRASRGGRLRVAAPLPAGVQRRLRRCVRDDAVDGEARRALRPAAAAAALPPVPSRPPAAETAVRRPLPDGGRRRGAVDGGLRPLPTAALVDALGSLAADRACAAVPGPTAGAPRRAHVHGGGRDRRRGGERPLPRVHAAAGNRGGDAGRPGSGRARPGDGARRPRRCGGRGDERVGEDPTVAGRSLRGRPHGGRRHDGGGVAGDGGGVRPACPGEGLRVA